MGSSAAARHGGALRVSVCYRCLLRQGAKRHPTMKVFGLTGGIGMGKSACAELVKARSIPVVDTDDLARQVVEPGEPALAEVVNAFGRDVLDEAGKLRRDELGRRVFADAAARKRLEEILHPRIRDLWRAQVRRWAEQGHRCAFVIVPLLFETRAEKEFDAVVCVACSAATQRQRLAARGWPPDKIERRMAAQLPIAAKLAQADFVIWSEGSLEVHG